MEIVEGFEKGRARLERRPGFDMQPFRPAPVGLAAVQERVEALFGEGVSALDAVRRILADVRQKGDAAAREYTQRIDGAELEALEVPKERWSAALDGLPTELAEALKTAAERVRAFHQASMPQAWHDQEQGYGETIVPLDRVGLYVPGGTAGYPSTVLMDAIPAKVAGVAEVVVCTPRPDATTLAAAYIAGVDRLFQIGGAQAIAAMAYGTESVPRVDKICGPGNVFVALAKREVYGDVEIDGLYGPTETVLVADDSADPALCAADLLAQAEHDVMASPILVTTSRKLAEKVSAEVERQMASLERWEIAAAAMGGQGLAVVVETPEQAIELSNAYAPEHVCLLLRDPWIYVPLARNAGGIFVGEHSPEVMGDYIAGPSHTMPTGGTARHGSYLGVHHFLKRVPVVDLSAKQLRELGPKAAALAEAEGLTAHAKAVELRRKGRGATTEARDDQG